jgi:uncharacterized protein (DUF1330 family)
MAGVIFVSLGTPDPDQGEALKTYIEAAPKLLLAAGGVPVKRMKVTETLLGGDGPATVFLMEFPSAEAIKGVLASDDYQQLVPHRDKAFKELTFLLAESF